MEIDNSQTLLMDDDQCKSVAGPEPDDVDAAVIKQDVQVTNDDAVDQLTAENVRTSSTNCT